MVLKYLFPAIRTWRHRRESVAEFDRLRRHDAPFDNWVTDVDMEHAAAAVARNDRIEAERLWAKAYSSNPARLKDSPEALKVAIALGHFDEMESITVTAMKAAPNNGRYASNYAEIAQGRGDFDEALARWKAVMRKFSMFPKPWLSAAACLRRLGRLDEADATLARGLRQFSDDASLLLEHGRLAVARRDWPEAYRRWEQVRIRHNLCGGYVGMAEAAREMGQYQKAHEILQEAQSLFPTNSAPFIELALLTRLRENLAAELDQWELVRRRFPMIPTGHIEGARALVKADRIAEAEALLLDAADRFKDNPIPLVEYARIPHAREDWLQASERWEKVRQRFPDVPEGYRLGAVALTALGRDAEAHAVRAGQTMCSSSAY